MRVGGLGWIDASRAGIALAGVIRLWEVGDIFLYFLSRAGTRVVFCGRVFVDSAQVDIIIQCGLLSAFTKFP